jgi:hypothetical protein
VSKDGRVLVSQVLKRKERDQNDYYDTYAFLKNSAGEWIKKKINPDKVEIKDRMMLSGNGRRLFWNRWPEESGINSPLH